MSTARSTGLLAVAFAVVAVGACSSSGAPAATGDADAGDQGSSGGDASPSRTDSGAGTSGGASSEGGGFDAAPVGTAADAAGGACATRSGAARGLVTRTLKVGGVDRHVAVYLPATLDARKPVPFVVAYHGWDASANDMHDITQLTDLADKEGIAVAFPEGEAGYDSLLPPWNCGANVCPSLAIVTPVASGDDLGFLDAILADVRQDQCLDAAHLYVTGFSMGGYFTHHVGCMRADIRAVAPHSGGTHDLGACPVARKPIIMFHGDADDMIPVGCDDPKATNTPLGVTASATAWAKKNGCGATTTSVAVQGGECRYYDGCPADGQVALCVFHGMKHCWAGGPTSGGDGCPGFASATALQWEFYKKYAW